MRGEYRMSERCEHHDMLSAKVDDVKQETTKIIVGLYGPLDQPGVGFINKVMSALEDLKNQMCEVKKYIQEQKDQDKANKAVKTSAILAALSAFFAAVVNLLK